MRKLVILYPAHFEQSSGGAETQISYLVEAAVHLGFEVYYIYVDNGRPIHSVSNLVLCPMSSKKTISVLGKGWFRYKTQIERYLNRIRPDVIYTRHYSSWVYFGALYAKQNHVKHVYAIASDYASEKHNPQVFPRFFSYIDNRLYIKGVWLTDCFIVQNSYQQQHLYSCYGKSGVLINQMSPGVSPSAICKDYGIIRIVWIANFKTVKRPELFINLVKRLSFASDKIKMTMCGRCSEQYKGLIEDATNYGFFEYVGELKQEDVFALLAKSHILVNTSQYEGFSNTFVQAWMRKVVVLSMNSNPNGIITNQCIGFVTPEIDELVEKISLLIRNKDLLKNMAEKAYVYAIDNLSVEMNMPKVLSVLND